MPECRVTSAAARHVLADTLWDAMLIPPAFPPAGGGLLGVWRSRMYPALMRRQVHAVFAHRSPEPWLTINCLLRSMTGDGYQHRERRYEGLVGGGVTESEYKAVIDGQFRAPLLMLCGFPRSGTTSVQAVLRYAFASHVPEIPSAHQRFSLWEYPKHDVQTAVTLASMPAADVRVIVAIRRFEDAVASLAVGRGSLNLVDLPLKVQRWNAWAQLCQGGSVTCLPFETITALRPRALAEHLRRAVDVEPEQEIDPTWDYQTLMDAKGKGDTSSSRQSNVPDPARSAELAQVRQEVITWLGSDRLQDLRRTYDEVVASGISALGTEDPA